MVNRSYFSLALMVRSQSEAVNLPTLFLAEGTAGAPMQWACRRQKILYLFLAVTRRFVDSSRTITRGAVVEIPDNWKTRRSECVTHFFRGTTLSDIPDFGRHPSRRVWHDSECLSDPFMR